MLNSNKGDDNEGAMSYRELQVTSGGLVLSKQGAPVYEHQPSSTSFGFTKPSQSRKESWRGARNGAKSIASGAVAGKQKKPRYGAKAGGWPAPKPLDAGKSTEAQEGDFKSVRIDRKDVSEVNGDEEIIDIDGAPLAALPAVPNKFNTSSAKDILLVNNLAADITNLQFHPQPISLQQPSS